MALSRFRDNVKKYGLSKPPQKPKPKVRSKVTAITPTGDRPLAFALCQQWMKNQTRPPDQWLVVDDGKVPMIPSWGMQYVRREPQPEDPKHTLALNLRAALPLIQGDNVVIIEDDEYYAPDYIKEMSRQLDEHRVVGIMRAKYYHIVSGGYMQIANTAHASLAETGFKKSFIPTVKELLEASSNPFLDTRLWQKAGSLGYLFVDAKKPLYLGMKGLPGRAGIGAGHKTTLYKTVDSSDRAILKRWVPKDFRVYMDILNGKLTEDNYKSYFPNVLPITGVSVCWNSQALIERAYNSIRKFHPDMPIIIVDGSDAGDPCAAYVKSLASYKTTVISLGYNIGHGRGLCMGLDKVRTRYALVFDSDIEMLKSPTEAMLAMMEPDTFGVGYIEKTGFDGYNYGAHSHHVREGWMPYLHPYFQLIDVGNYKKYHRYVHHGAPCFLTMLDIYKKGLSNKVLKEFAGLGHSAGQGFTWKGALREYIHHIPRGTRSIRTARGLPEIEQQWEYR